MKNLTKILLIDDDEVCNWLNKLLLEEMQLATQIECLTDGESAYNYLNKSCGKEGNSLCPDLIFLDLNMPGMDGFQLLEKLKETPGCAWLCEKRIVVLSSSMHMTDVMQAARFKVHSYLVKPLTKTKVKRLLENRMHQQHESSSEGADSAVSDRKPAPSQAGTPEQKHTPKKES